MQDGDGGEARRPSNARPVQDVEAVDLLGLHVTDVVRQRRGRRKAPGNLNNFERSFCYVANEFEPTVIKMGGKLMRTI